MLAYHFNIQFSDSFTLWISIKSFPIYPHKTFLMHIHGLFFYIPLKIIYLAIFRNSYSVLPKRFFKNHLKFQKFITFAATYPFFTGATIIQKIFLLLTPTVNKECFATSLTVSPTGNLFSIKRSQHLWDAWNFWLISSAHFQTAGTIQSFYAVRLTISVVSLPTN